MKTPIFYYGGKQSMLQYILPLIPKHNAYVEPFCGGCAVFWAKDNPAKLEIINDHSGFVINFYEQLKNNFYELQKIIAETPCSRDVYKRAMTVYDVPHMFSKIERAWAFWVGTTQGYSHQIGSWRSNSLTGKEVNITNSKKIAFTRELSERLNSVQIENKDACELIADMDSEDTFFYIDAPYVGSNQGHYGGYMQSHFDTLLSTLSAIKGKFLLSSYPNDNLAEYTAKCGWWSKPIDMALNASNTRGKRKTEMLTGNYEI